MPCDCIVPHYAILQNHRTEAVGRDLKIIWSNPLAKTGSLEQIAQVGIQTGLEYL